MQSAIVFASLFAMACAGGLPAYHPGGIPTAHGVITGVADTPEVSIAKAQHFAAHAAARGFGGVPLAGIPTAHGVITGVADTPEVNAAKAHHFAAHAAARGAVVGYSAAGPVVARAVPLAGIPTAHGVITGVADTPEVNAAKAQHFAAHAAARGIAVGYAAAPVAVGYGYAAAPVAVGYGYAAGVPIAGIPTAHGVITGVADTPEVNAAKAQHFAAHAAELARHG